MSEAKKKEPLNVYQRLNAVREEVKYLQKDKEVQGYKVVTHDQVTAAVRGPFIKHGIIVVPRQMSSRHEQVGQTQGGAPIIRYEALYEIDFVNCDVPQDKVTVCQEAHAMDHGDKAPGKACSYAVKYAMLKVLSIETGENEESRYEMNSSLTAEQIGYIKEILDEAEIGVDEILRKVNGAFKCSAKRLSEIPAKHYEGCLKIIRCERAANENADSVVLIKEGIKENDLVRVYEAWQELDNETKQDLWLAPTKGGVFTTEERTVMKSDEFARIGREQREVA